MAIYQKNMEKRRILQDFRRHEEEVIGSLCRLSNRPVSPKTQMEQERRIRREIANSNERRRMQSINAGFQSLRTLLPHHEGEKLSKAAILQQTTQYIYQLEQEKTRLLSQNCQLKRLLNQQNQDSDGGSSSDSPIPKRKKSDAETLPFDDVVVNASSSPEYGETSIEKLKQEMIELRSQLMNERRVRMLLERNLEAKLCEDSNRESGSKVQVQYNGTIVPEAYKTVEVRCSGSVSPIAKSPPPSPPPASTILVSVDSSTHIISTDATTTATTTTSSIIPTSPCVQEIRVPPISQQETYSEAGDEVEEEVVMEEEEITAGFGSSPYQSSYVTQNVATKTIMPTLASTSRQNLETIVEAIRHLEGDHLFNDDPAPRRIATAQVKKEPSSPPNGLSMASATVTVTPTDLAYRHHVIRSSQPQTRPGVIVSAHS